VRSEAIPFMDVSGVLDGSMAGDVGFDPLGFADHPDNLVRYREAEIKHARLAMLAAAGWPLSELFDKKIANFLGMPAVLDDANRVPSVLNGGMGKISPLYWVSCIMLAASVELYGMFGASKKKGYFPGNFGFDPFGLYPTNEKDQKWMQTAEIKNGRLAMLAITGFCFQEVVTHIAVVDQTPIFFKPILQVLNENVPDYVIPEDIVKEAATSTTSALDSVTGNTMESITVTPPVDIIPPVVENIPSVDIIPPVDTIPPVNADDFLAAPVDTVPPVDTISDTNVAPTVSAEEYAAAKKKIAELESKLAAIDELLH